MSFILDALRKSEHERQRSTVPGLAQVPLATPRTELPRWAIALMGVLAAAVLVLGGAWWQSQRNGPPTAAAVAPPAAAPVERRLALPLPSSTVAPVTTPPAGLPASVATRLELPPSPTQSLAQAAASAPAPEAVEPPASSLAAATANAPATNSAETTLPSAAALAAQGILLPQLRLELHAYAERPADRFVFINGRKYAEGQRLSEGPEIVSIAPNGAVLSHLGHRFLLSPE
jgi:general secretion pathway protein B